MGAVPKRWKNLISENGKLHDIKNDIVDRLKSDKKTCKYVYKLYLENIKESSLRSQNKWAKELGIQIDDWGYIYSSLLGLQETLSLKTFSSNFPI